MSIEKSQLKMLVANNLGSDIEDKLEASEREYHNILGACEALKLASKKVPLDLCSRVNALLEQGEIEDSMPAAKVAELVNKYLIKVGDFLQHLSDVQKTASISVSGRIEGLKISVAHIKKMCLTEGEKIQALQKYESEPLDSKMRRPDGAHPGKSSLAERRAAGKAEKEAKDAEKKTPKKKTKKKAKAKAKVA